MKPLHPGTRVVVQAAGNRKLRRIVVEDRAEVILISTEEEYASARAEGREPVSIGFRREWVEQISETPRKAAHGEYRA